MSATIVKLSDGSSVTFVSRYTHKADRAFDDVMNKGIVYRTNEDGEAVPDGIPAENITGAYEAVMPFVIDSIKNGEEQHAFTKDWLDNITASDYKLLRDAVTKLKSASESDKDAGKKNS